MPVSLRRSGLLTAVALVMTLAACEDPAQQAADHFEKGIEFQEQGNLDKALVELKSALELAPENPETSWRIGRIEEERGDVRTAFRYYLRAADPALGHMDAQVRVIELLMAAGRLDDAASRAAMAIGLEPNNADLLALRAAVLQMRGEAEDAASDAAAALRAEPGHGGATAVLATVHLNEGDYARARSVLTEAIDETEPDVALVRLLGLAYAADGKAEQAVQEFRRLVELQPGDAGHRRSLADLLAATGKVEEGEEVLRAGFEAPEADREAMSVAYVEYLARHRSLDAAVGELEKLIADNPDTSTYDIALANLRAQSGDTRAAIEVLTGASDRLGETEAGLRARGMLAQYWMTVGEGRKALDLARSVLAATPNNVDALLVRAALNSNGGRNDEAVRDLNAILAAEPGNAVALRMLAEQHRRSGNPAEAASVLQQLVDLAPQAGQARLQLAAMLQQSGDAGQAQAIVEEQVRRNPASVEAWRELAHLAMERDDWTAAENAARRLGEIPGAERERLRLLAEMAAARSDYPQAAEGFRKVLETTADQGLDRAALRAFVDASLKGGMADSAEEVLTGITQREDGADAHLAWMLLAQVHRAADQDGRVVQDLLSAIDAQPTASEPYVDVARIRALGGDAPGAMEILERGLEAGADRVPLLVTRGMVQELTGDIDAAIASYREALRVNPSSVVAANNYGSLVADRHAEDPEALKEALALVESFAGSGDALLIDTVAWLNYRLGNLDVARTLLERAGAETHQNPQLRYHYGAVLLASGDEEKAQGVLSSTVGHEFPGSEDVARLLVSN